MTIKCTLKRAMPLNVNYTWYSCDTDCGSNSSPEWKLESHNYSLRVNNQLTPEMRYRCTAKNVVGEDESRAIIVMKAGISVPVSANSTSSKAALTFILIPVLTISMILLITTSFVLYRRKKIYGGLYLFSYPPFPDFMESLDVNGNIQEQLQKLPFIPEWEFPRERISFSKYIMFSCPVPKQHLHDMAKFDARQLQ